MSYIALMAYIVAFVNIILFFMLGNRLLKVFFNIFMGIGFFANFHELTVIWYITGIFPTAGLCGFMHVLSASFVVTYFIIYAKYKRPLLGMFITPFNIILSAVAIGTADYQSSYVFVDSVWRYGHLPFVILGTTFFIASFLASVMYFIQERQLKSKQFGVVFKRFPPLDTINRINATSLKWGFYFFTIGVMLGFAWMVDENLEGIFTSYKIIFSLITWVVFAVIFFVKHFKGLSPRKMALYTILGFLSVLITYIGVAAFLIR